jgi:hypothetical protein
MSIFLWKPGRGIAQSNLLGYRSICTIFNSNNCTLLTTESIQLIDDSIPFRQKKEILSIKLQRSKWNIVHQTQKQNNLHMVHELMLQVLHLIASKLLNRGEQNYQLSHPGDHRSICTIFHSNKCTLLTIESSIPNHWWPNTI